MVVEVLGKTAQGVAGCEIGRDLDSQARGVNRSEEHANEQGSDAGGV